MESGILGGSLGRLPPSAGDDCETQHFRAGPRPAKLTCQLQSGSCVDTDVIELTASNPAWRRGTKRGIGLLLASAIALLIVPASSRASLQLGLQDVGFENPAGQPYAQIAQNAMRIIHGNVVRIEVAWSSVAPATPAPGFNPANPADPNYSWGGIDEQVFSAVQHHERVLLYTLQAPTWAEGPNPPSNDPHLGPGAWDPSPAQFAAFMHAAAVRYGGSFPNPNGGTLPRVSYWELWDEPNLPDYLAAPNVVDEYRALLNAGYGAVKGVHSDNVVVTGGLAPISSEPPFSTRPLTFAASLLCLRATGHGYARAASCPTRAHFDALAYHPYTVGATPTEPGFFHGDILVANAPQVAQLLSASDRLHTSLGGPHGIWVTEWTWLTDPPTSAGDRPSTAARYVAYSLYEFAHSDVSLVIWFTVTDNQFGAPGAGLYSSSGAPKLTLRAFAFPFVAVHSGGRILAWGRAPVGGGATVLVQRLLGSHWVRVARVHTAGDGEFSASLRSSGNSTYRATVVGGPQSLPYNSAPIPARRTHNFTFG